MIVYKRLGFVSVGILGEENEAVVSTPPFFGSPFSKIAHTVSILSRCCLEVIMKSGQKVGNIEIDST